MLSEINLIRYKAEKQIIEEILASKITEQLNWEKIISHGEELVETIRNSKSFSMENFLSIYNLSSQEGIAILGLAEALLRIPDPNNSQKLINDKLGNKNWQHYLLKQNISFKSLVTTFGLYFSGKVADITTMDNILSKLVERLGTKIFVTTVKAAILYLSKEFIFAENIEEAIKLQATTPSDHFAFDLLGESARTEYHADIYYAQYQEAIKLLGAEFNSSRYQASVKPNLSIKLTALHPRFEYSKLSELETGFFDKVVTLVEQAMQNQLTVTFDAEESFRTDIYLTFVTKLIKHKSFQNFHGIGLVVQAYQKIGLEVIEHIVNLAKDTGKVIPIRLVKGAYWDSEIKRSQELGLRDYPVFTTKEYTDLNYIACARKIFDHSECLYPQIATHNALTVATIIDIAQNKKFEFQKLYGMGDVLHKKLAENYQVRTYAPVGTTKDLLAYLMRRMLENGASSNFVNKVSDHTVPVSQIIYNIKDKVTYLIQEASKITLPEDIYLNRKNSMGYDLGYKSDFNHLNSEIARYNDKIYNIGSIINGKEIIKDKHALELFRPAKYAEKFSSYSNAVENEITNAIESATQAFEKWTNLDVEERANILNNIADQFEQNKSELYSILIKEAGKTISDAINEVIEAVDFCRYYAVQAKNIMSTKQLAGPTGEDNFLSLHGRGVFICISPWNFPLAIFTGQVVAALVTGNAVIAKPALQTPVIANYAVKLMHQAGIPKSILHLIFSTGENISKYAIANNKIAGVVFTGSCATAKLINKTLALEHDAILPFIAETGGQNAMIVDSSALLEQVTDDVLLSAFYSAGQRCSALRILYIQEEIYTDLFAMIEKAMALIKVGDTIDFSHDIGPVIDQVSKERLLAHIADMKQKGFKVISHPQSNNQNTGHYFYPHIIEINSINDIESEKFGPILHIVKYHTTNLDQIISEINDYGYGLTFGIHSRIEERINYIKSRIKAGNIYANRSMTGAKVESQPFGGENMSGTGFKAGGPHYLLKFLTERTVSVNVTAFGGNVKLLNM
ncbi:MAG: bifunctional proline dehydrogenase/L-glutamate gamma-semialdehyde dehydrogenase PutA [Rickettsiaceae bacterium]|nr:bifunctional proline dehydrogenase/L-glutamate gamma-semialdehyde dehydrogenase PutA [Rickettsiaceae bacterium]